MALTIFSGMMETNTPKRAAFPVLDWLWRLAVRSEDQITVLTGMATRHDGALTGLAIEFRGLVQSVGRIEG